MSKEPADKHQILLKGGSHKEPNDSIENWLNFLTDPSNLQPGLPPITINCLSHQGTFVCEIYANFSETKPSLKLLRLSLDYYNEVLLTIFQETNQEERAKKLANKTYDANNPHCLRDWVFGLFKHSELEHLAVKFLNTELPDLFDQLPNLKYITFSGSKIKSLPSSFYRLPALEYLIISDCGITEVPAELGQIQTLKNLEFSQPCSPKVLGSLRKLTILKCTTYRFNIPIEITQLTDLKKLTLTSVNAAPENFLNFPNLEDLTFHINRDHVVFRFTEANTPRLKNLNTNYLAAFSTSLGKCESLESFRLTEGFNKPNNFELPVSEHDTLATAFKQLRKLKVIDLEGSGIVDMTFCLSNPKLEHIYLSRNRIIEIPYALAEELPDLKGLILRSNKIVSVPQGLHKLSKLKTFDLSNNKICQVPSELFHLFESGVLDLKGNPFRNFPDSDLKKEIKTGIIQNGGTHTLNHEKGETIEEWLAFITDPKNLQPGLPDILISTELHYFEDSTLTVSFDNHKPSLRSLKYELGANEDTGIFIDSSQPNNADQKKQLQRWISNLFQHTELEELQIPFLNPELPDLFGSLKKLHRVDFSKSKLIRLPPSFCQLSALTTLWLNDTTLTELPVNINQLTNLVSIHLSGSTLTKLPNELLQLKNLEALNVGWTPITELPDCFDSLSKLKHLNLSGTKLTQLPPSFVQLQSLESLSIDGTAITDIANRFNALSNLKSISLNKSKLKQLPAGFFQLPLERLDLSNSSLPEIPVELGQLQSLRYLAISQPCVPGAWAGLTELEELQCYCPNFDVPEEFSGLINLKTLHLNSVASATTKSFNLPKLENLSLKVSKNHTPFNLQGYLPSLKVLTTNCFQAFVHCLGRAKNLEKIIAYGTIDQSHVQPLNESFKRLTKLIHLELRGAGISDMEFTTYAFNLEYLDLSENELADIPRSLSKLQKLQRLILNKNPLVDFLELDIMPALSHIQFQETKMPMDQVSPSEHPDSAILKRMASNFPNAFLNHSQ